MLIKLKSFQLIFENFLNIKFYENLPLESGVVPREQTDGGRDRHDEANSRFWKFSKKRLKRGQSFTVKSW
jgi:hypothetical protein